MSRVGIAEIWARSYAEAPECQRAIIGENCQALLDEIARLREQVAVLQAPPTGEEVERAWSEWLDVRDRFDAGLVPMLATIDAVVRAYGSACAAKARSEIIDQLTTETR